MRSYLALVSLIAWPTVSPAAELVCTVPPAAVAAASEICETIREGHRVRADNWGTDVCATELLRLGLLTAARQLATKEARAVTRTLVTDTVTAYEADHPSTLILSACGP